MFSEDSGKRQGALTSLSTDALDSASDKEVSCLSQADQGSNESRFL